MIIVIFFVAHWYASLFFQSFFNHRYAAHRMFTMSLFWEKVCYIGSYLTNGSSYLSPRAYAILHRQHHAHADTAKDPHSPLYSRGLFSMMWKTKKIYSAVYKGTSDVDDKFTKNLPRWDAFDKFAKSWGSAIFWIGLYTAFYIVFATAWWQFLLLPATIVMGPLHGAIINFFAHKVGYRNFKLKNTSRNFLPVDFLMLGESYHNNHHKRGSNPNFGFRWFEFDPVYPFILLFNRLGIIRLRAQPVAVASPVRD